MVKRPVPKENGENAFCSGAGGGGGEGELTRISKVTWQYDVGPGLAQLLERLTHRYSESTSSNPDNLTSATVCGTGLVAMPTTKRSACVASELDLGKCTLHLPPQK